MKILIVEDNLDRITYFKELLKEHDLFITKDIMIALDYMRLTEIDIAFLDHDLDENNLNSLNNGYELVKKITELKTGENALYYIHSMNPAGANKMVSLLKDNGYYAEWFPFHLLREKNKYLKEER